MCNVIPESILWNICTLIINCLFSEKRNVSDRWIVPLTGFMLFGEVGKVQYLVHTHSHTQYHSMSSLSAVKLQEICAVWVCFCNGVLSGNIYKEGQSVSVALCVSDIAGGRRQSLCKCSTFTPSVFGIWPVKTTGGRYIKAPPYWQKKRVVKSSRRMKGFFFLRFWDHKVTSWVPVHCEPTTHNHNNTIKTLFKSIRKNKQSNK